MEGLRLFFDIIWVNDTDARDRLSVPPVQHERAFYSTPLYLSKKFVQNRIDFNERSLPTSGGKRFCFFL